VQEIIFGGTKHIMGYFEGFFERSRPCRKIPKMPHYAFGPRQKIIIFCPFRIRGTFFMSQRERERGGGHREREQEQE
jgi:hypothetical protein